MGLLQIHIKVSLKKFCLQMASRKELSQRCTSSWPYVLTGTQRLNAGYTSVSFLRVQKKEYKKRATTTLPFKLADGVELGVSV